MSDTSVIHAGRLRTKKETFYLLLFCLIAFCIWSWFGFSAYRQISGLFGSESEDSVCYARDSISNTVTKVNKNLLFFGEKCLSWNDLTKEEQKKVKSAEDDVISVITLNLTTPILFLGFFLFTLFVRYLSISFIRMNAVMVGEHQYPELWKSLQDVSRRLEFQKQPDMFVVLGQGALNAFATRLAFRQFVVVFSELADALIEENDQKQLEAVLSHEIGHHALGHTNLFLDLFLLPLEYIPAFMLPLSRAREYSADNVMHALVPDTKACERAFIKLSVGKKFGNRTDIDAFLNQAYEEQGFFSWLSEKISTHPHLPNRIRAIRGE